MKDVILDDSDILPVTLPFEIVGLNPKGENCGHVRSIKSCGDIGHGIETSHIFCQNRTCCYCWSDWRAKQVERTVERLEAIEKLYKKMGWLTKRDLDGNTKRKGLTPLGACKHIVISPPQEWAKERLESGISGIRYIRQVMGEKMKEAGLRGGTVIFHPFRCTDEAKAEFELAKAMGYKKGIWKWSKHNRSVIGGISSSFD